MFANLQIFIELLDKDEIRMINKYLNKVIHGYSFYYISEEEDHNSSSNFHQSLINSKLIVIKYHEIDPHFILGFEKTILIIQKSSLNMLLPLFQEDKEICFLDGSKQIFDDSIKIKYIESVNNEYFQTELSNFNDKFKLNSSKKAQIFGIIQPCITGYLLKVGYSKLRKDRFIEFNSPKHQQKPRQIDNDEYIEIRLLGSGSTSHVHLVYLIESEELLTIKKPYGTDEKIPKLVEREIRNYNEINYPLTPKFYGTTKKK